MFRNCFTWMGAACVLWSFSAVPSVRADEIDPLLFKDAADLMKVLRSRGYKNIGVLKFEVQKGGDKGLISMSNGSLNSMMATRLENALILANQDDNPLGITRNASEAAARVDKTAGYHSKDTREKLFEHAYPLAWGSNKVKVDVFLTGRVTVAPDYKSSTVTLRMFDKANPTKITDVARFQAPVDRSLIADMGQPFAVSKATIKKRALLISPATGNEPGAPVSTAEDMVLEDVQKSAKSADEDRNRPARPIIDPAVGPGPGVGQLAPVVPVNNVQQRIQVQAQRPSLAAAKAELDSVLKFDVYYNDQLVAWTADNRLPTPNPGDKIEFRVRATERVGMVLRVNGVNTADYDRTEKQIQDYSMWVLQPNMDYTIRGFYPANDKVVLFTAAKRDEVDLAELGNERRIGKIDLDILREMPQQANNGGGELSIAKRGMDLRGVATGGSVSEVKGKLRSLSSRKVAVTKRNLMVGGEVDNANVETTTFQGVHAIHLPITYFDPRSEATTFLSPENE